MKERMSANGKYFTAPNLYILWAIVTGFSIVVVPLILGLTSSGGEQKPLIWIAFALKYIILGFMLLSILTTLVFKEWVKKCWHINLFVFGLTAWVLFSYYFQ
ncbi:hypothetical protein [Pontibacter rugosus]|uniref:Uncharacterized protein n=1 Tax=Pontibacter rugosus TaxID=1745966 RepID=A0ABW3SUE0_9BACT